MGDYGNARIFVQTASSGIITGIQHANGVYVTAEEKPVLNATEGLTLQVVIAWPSRLIYVEVVPAEEEFLAGFNFR